MWQAVALALGLIFFLCSPAEAVEYYMPPTYYSDETCLLSIFEAFQRTALKYHLHLILVFAPLYLGIVLSLATKYLKKPHIKTPALKAVLQHRLFFPSVYFTLLGWGFFYFYMNGLSPHNFTFPARVDDIYKSLSLRICAVYAVFCFFIYQLVAAVFSYKRKQELPLLFKAVPYAHLKKSLVAASCLLAFSMISITFFLSYHVYKAACFRVAMIP
ncbi:MAG: hypothetical protein ACK4PK_09135 [Alphaproteobacteria bacterium]